MSKKTDKKKTIRNRVASKAPTRAQLAAAVKRNNSFVMDTHVGLQRSAMAINRIELFLFGLIKYLRDEGTVDLQEFDMYMRMLLETEDLEQYWLADFDAFVAKKLTEVEADQKDSDGEEILVEAPGSFPALGELAAKIEARAAELATQATAAQVVPEAAVRPPTVEKKAVDDSVVEALVDELPASEVEVPGEIAS